MSSQQKVMELRPNRSLLNSNFDGYKLSLQAIPTITKQLEKPVDRLVPNVNQYSLLHAKLYVLHNHLIGECDESESVYFINKELEVNKYSLDTLSNEFDNDVLWKIPLQRERHSGDYNVSMKFASEQIAVVSDGMGNLYVLDRGVKNQNDKWKVIFSGEVIGPDQNFIITDVVFKESTNPEIHVLLLSIRQEESNERHSTILHWITLSKSDSWNQVALRELTIKGFVQYSSLERSCKAIYVVSDSGCKFTLDSENEIHEVKENDEIVKKYTWTQSKEDVTMKFSFPEKIIKQLINIKTESSHIEIKYGEEMLLEGCLYQTIDPDMTCWTFNDRILEVVIHKSENGLMWPEIVKQDKSGEYVADPALLNEITERLAPLCSDTEVSPPSGTTFNSQQVEECDFETDKLTVFERLCHDSHNVTHKVNFGSHQVLLTVELDKKSPPALAVRSDVDACIWQPIIQEDEFTIEHKGTLLALGYIQASKQQMKFFVCSPDLSYSVICESTKHVFIYCQKKSITSTELRNRVTGQRINTLAQQQVYTVPSNDEIVGIYASNSYLYILSENFITVLKL